MKRLLAILSILFVLFLPGVVSSQEPLRIPGLRGLATAQNRFVLEANQALRAHNFDFSRRGIGTISPRQGFEKVCSKAGQDSIVMLMPYYTADGRRRLICVTDSAGAGYGNVYVTRAGSDRIDSSTRIFTHWPVVEPTRGAILKDKVYFVNGCGKGKMWDGRTVRDWPMRAPGEVTVVPLTDSGGLTGIFRYRVDYAVLGLDTTYMDAIGGYVTQPVRVNRGKVQIRDFTWPNADSAMTEGFGGYVNSYTVRIYRSRSDYGSLDELDSCVLIKTLVLTKTNIDTLTVLDTLSSSIGDTIRGAVYVKLLVDQTLRGRDSTGAMKWAPYAPTFLDSNDSGHIWDTAGIGYAPKSVYGYMYYYTRVDTMTGNESDTSRGLLIVRNGSEDGYRIGFPPMPKVDTGIVYNVYRRKVFVGKWFYVKYPIINGGIIPLPDIRSLPESLRADQYLFKIGSVSPSRDTLATVQFYDTLRYDTVENRPVYRDNNVPQLMRNILSYNNVMYASAGSMVYYTSFDSTTRFSLFNASQINPSEGADIQTMWATRTALRVATSDQKYNLPWETMKPELSDAIGCLSPDGHVPTAYGECYLSKRGFEIENEGMALERTFSGEPLSGAIDNFQKLKVSDRKRAIAVYLPREQKVGCSVGDTFYVYDFLAKEWATWSIRMRAWCLYDTTTLLNQGRGDRLYFVPPGTSTLLKFGSEDYSEGIYADTGEAIPLLWESGLLFKGEKSRVQVDAVGLWYRSLYDSIGLPEYVAVDFVGANDSALCEDSLSYSRFTCQAGEYAVEEKLSRPSFFTRMRIYSDSEVAVYPWWTVAIEQIDIWARPVERVR